ncbi:hypothetical protein C9374_000657 [Naegleria lovaniensis]|uniref:Uncharacterized protein n=1 Tax=Naegleria lovaniensis TaxID=51637 RepID=A0AA88KNF5_NAELO|nr:uncharacterized protein C9374_000657 [Naegleria lovaniensis]KAG2388493.1 hypothetical protein C9374_000657 [Naegleria lovaniensis]
MEDPKRSKSVQDVRSRLRETQQKRKDFYKSSHSIPSRFETKLNSSSLEKKGFGTSSCRFQVFVNDLGGPNATTYSINRELLERKTSDSKKGYGYMVSNTKRWYDAPRSTFITPGPGSTEPLQFFSSTTIQDKRIPSSAGVGSRAFLSSSPTKTKIESETPPTVGPGTYNVCESSFDKKRVGSAGKSSMFASKTKRFSEENRSSSPTDIVNHFEESIEEKYERENPSRGIYRIREKKELPQAIFRSTTRRDIENGKPQYESIDISEITKPKSASRSTREIQIDDSDKDPRSFFFKNDAIDRFGNFTGKTRKKKHSKEQPDPIYYPTTDRFGSNLADKDNKKHISSSFFVSNSKRDPYVPTENADLYPGKYDYSQLFATGKTRTFNANKRGIFL